jgi:hypothetical protein
MTIIEFSVDDLNMKLIEKKVTGSGPVGMINQSLNGVMRQYRRMTWTELTPDQRKIYKDDFPNGEYSNEDYKLSILKEALNRKRQFVQDQEERKRTKLSKKSDSESKKDIDMTEE